MIPPGIHTGHGGWEMGQLLEGGYILPPGVSRWGFYNGLGRCLLEEALEEEVHILRGRQCTVSPRLAVD